MTAIAECRARIDARDPLIHAWQHVDRNASTGGGGVLQGVCAGVKDVIDVRGMPTRHGSALYQSHVAQHDAACVAALRGAGAIILGKTTSTEFASPVAVGVANPRDLTRTAGVSSSGSAAAVADGMAHVAIGTQTGGSIIRPASYCGIVGFKPSIDAIDRSGILHVRPSLDTVGAFARTIDMVALTYTALAGAPPAREATAPATVGVCRTAEWPHARSETREAIDLVAAECRASGVDVVDIEVPPAFGGALDAFRIIVIVETASTMAAEFARGLDTMNGWLQQTARDATRITDDDYRKALNVAQRCREALQPIFDRCDALLTPATAGEAPARLTGLDDPYFCPLWTMMHGPALCVPVHEGPNGMPVGVQLVGRPGDDDKLLCIGRWIERAVRSRHERPGSSR